MLSEQGIYLSVVIPAHNEAERIGASLETILSYLDRQPWKSEVLVVADGCRDGTAAKSRRVARQHSATLRILENDVNRGKGFSVKCGMLASRGKFLLFSDADLSTPIEECVRLITALHRGYDVAIASRRLNDSDVRVQQNTRRRVMGRVFSQAVGALALPGILDSQCGFKCFGRDTAQQVFRRQRINGFAFDVEVLLIARRRGYRIAEVPVTWEDRQLSRVHPFRDSASMVTDLVRIRANDLLGVYNNTAS